MRTEFGRQNVVEGAIEVDGGDGRGEGEAGDLGEGVDASVGAAGALGQNALASDAEEGVGEQALNGRKVRLDLPAVVGRAVVGEDELEVGHFEGAKYKVTWGGGAAVGILAGIPGESAADRTHGAHGNCAAPGLRSLRYAAGWIRGLWIVSCRANGVQLSAACLRNRDPAVGARLNQNHSEWMSVPLARVTDKARMVV